MSARSWLGLCGVILLATMGCEQDKLISFGQDMDQLRTAAPAKKAGKPLAFVGDMIETRAVQMDVTNDSCIRTERLEGWPQPADYANYAVVYLGGYLGRKAKEENWPLWKGASDDVLAYVRAGGVIVATEGNAAALEKSAGTNLFGVGKWLGGAVNATIVRDTATGKRWLWQKALSLHAERLAPETEILAEGEMKDGKRLIVATRRRVGKGAFYWTSFSNGALDMRFSSEKKVLGVADEKGIYVPTPEGESVRAMRTFFRDIFLFAENLDTTAPENEWKLKPLGEKGDLKMNATFAVKPTYRDTMPVFKTGLVFAQKGKAGVVVVGKTETPQYARTKWQDKNLQLAEELAWHLGQMCGLEIKVVQQMPVGSDVPVIMLGDDAWAAGIGVDLKRLPYGTSVIKRKGNVLYVGGTGAGRGYAVTYLLEAMGCRYLWPGVSGKVIPKIAGNLALPDLDWVYTPAFKFREVRVFAPSYKRDGENLQMIWGIDEQKLAAAMAKKNFDRKGNRDFWRWHGVNDECDLPGAWAWGHYFGDYWKKYGETHPDWFALQPTGSRYQELGRHQERPTLCVSNPGLIKQAAADAIAAFKKSPGLRSFSICLPDGGPTAQCMCEGCRKLDPINAAVNLFYVGTPWWRRYPYVALTDRMLTFDNAIAERLVKECPEAKLGVYIYSMYEVPSVKVKPHPALVMLTCAGDYSTVKTRDYARNNVAAWSHCDNMLLWRPNVFFQFALNAPHNYARRVFEDMEIFKRNHVCGTDFDCMNGQFAAKGLIWYMTAVAHRNPDAIGYETLLTDYCRAGFGAAADVMRSYFVALEEMYEQAAQDGRGEPAYVQALDFVRLEGIIAQAEKLAANEPAVLARIAYLKRGIDVGKVEKKLGEAWAAKSRAGVLEGQKELGAAMRRHAYDEPTAMYPAWMGGTYHSPHMKRPRF